MIINSKANHIYSKRPIAMNDCALHYNRRSGNMWLKMSTCSPRKWYYYPMIPRLWLTGESLSKLYGIKMRNEGRSIENFYANSRNTNFKIFNSTPNTADHQNYRFLHNSIGRRSHWTISLIEIICTFYNDKLQRKHNQKIPICKRSKRFK